MKNLYILKKEAARGERWRRIGRKVLNGVSRCGVILSFIFLIVAFGYEGPLWRIPLLAGIDILAMLGFMLIEANTGPEEQDSEIFPPRGEK